MTVVRNRAAVAHVLILATAATIAAWASAWTVRFSTPIDDALPFIAVILCVTAAATHQATALAVPLLVGGELALADERLRLLWFGVVIAATLGAALLMPKWRPARAAVIAVAAVLLLRWIPFPAPRWGREVLLLVLVMAIAAALRFTPFGVAVAVATALFTPAIPLRTFWIPLVVLVIATAVGGVAGRVPRAISASAIAVMLLFFAWSGTLARALPIALGGLPRATPRKTVAIALSPGESVDLDVPPGARALIASGANVPRLRRGTVVGRIEPGGEVIRIGDIADWGFLRLEHYYAAKNPLPSRPAGLVRGYGYEAWIDGAGRLPLPPATSVHVTADRGLPPAARLQVVAFELERR